MTDCVLSQSVINFPCFRKTGRFRWFGVEQWTLMALFWSTDCILTCGNVSLPCSLFLSHTFTHSVSESAAGNRKWIDFDWVILESHISLNLRMWLSRITQLNSSLIWFFSSIDNLVVSKKRIQNTNVILSGIFAYNRTEKKHTAWTQLLTTSHFLSMSTYSSLHCCSFHCFHLYLGFLRY